MTYLLGNLLARALLVLATSEIGGLLFVLVVLAVLVEAKLLLDGVDAFVEIVLGLALAGLGKSLLVWWCHGGGGVEVVLVDRGLPLSGLP
jgi:hypothetical protein